MEEKKVFAIILDYEYFKKLPEEKIEKMLAEKRVEWRIYIPREKADMLTPQEREKLHGFKITHMEPLKVRTFTAKEIFPKPTEIPVLIDNEKKSKYEKRSERKRLKRLVPLKMGVVNTKKKGCR